jgi:hypothetical protein
MKVLLRPPICTPARGLSQFATRELPSRTPQRLIARSSNVTAHLNGLMTNPHEESGLVSEDSPCGIC